MAKKQKPARPSPLVWAPCEHCRGTGWVGHVCGPCNGRGRRIINTAAAVADEHQNLLGAFAAAAKED